MTGGWRGSEASVAVVMATHNGGRYLQEQLESILIQTRLPDQIIVSDDSSSDDSLDIVRTILSGFQGELVAVTNPGPQGVVPNFTNGLRFADADLIALSDQDDIWHPEKLARMAAAFDERSGLLLLHSDARLVDAQGVPIGGTLLQSLVMTPRIRSEVHRGRAADALLRRNFVTGATVTIRRSLLERALPIPAGWLHDEWLGMAAAALGGLDVLEEALIDYRQHGGNEIGARVLGVTGRARRMTEPRAGRNARLLERAEQLPERLADLDVHPAFVTAARAKLVHERMRSALPSARIRRVPAVTRATLRGDYSRFGRGGADAVRDLIQPD